MTRNIIRTCAVGLGVSILAAGCAAVMAARGSPGTIKDGSLTPGRPPTASYGPDPGLNCSSQTIPIVSLDLEDKAKTNRTPVPKPDGRLCAAAEAFLGWDRKDLPDETVLRFVSWYFGLPAPVPATITGVPTEDPKVISSMVLDSISSFAKNAIQPRFGLATSRVAKDTSRLTLLMADVVLELEPVPKKLALNSQAPINGRLAGAYENPKVLISDVKGQLQTPPASPGKAVQAEVRCADVAGRIQVEIRAEQQGAESIVANFPVMCGAEPPTSVSVAPPSQGPMDPVREEKKVLDLVTAERTAVGLPAVAWDDAVAKVARTISESRKGGSQSQSDVVALLKEAGVISPLVLQNPGQGRSAEEAHTRFSYSPPHRANYMNPSATQAGIGVAVGTDANGKPSVFLTELFVKQLAAIDTEAVRKDLRAAIAKKRSDARVPPLASDPVLEDVAQKYAKALADAKGNLPKARADELLLPLHKTFRTVNVIPGVKNDPLEFAEEPGVAGPAKAVGIGVAQGANPTLGQNATYVVIITGTRR